MNQVKVPREQYGGSYGERFVGLCASLPTHSRATSAHRGRTAVYPICRLIGTETQELLRQWRQRSARLPKVKGKRSST